MQMSTFMILFAFAVGVWQAYRQPANAPPTPPATLPASQVSAPVRAPAHSAVRIPEHELALERNNALWPAVSVVSVEDTPASFTAHSDWKIHPN